MVIVKHERRTGKYPKKPRKYYRRLKEQYGRDTAMSSISRIPLAGMPLRKLIRMRYSDDVALSFTTAGFATAHVLRLNSIFDPDLTSVGHQPMGHDEWAQFYEHYTVLSARVRADFYPTSASGTLGNSTCGILFSHDSTPKTNGDNIIESGRAVWKRMGPRDGSPSSATVTRNWSAKKWFGPYTAREKYASDMGTNPGEIVYAHLFGIPVAELVSVSDSIRIRFAIDYLVLLDTPRDLIAS